MTTTKQYDLLNRLSSIFSSGSQLSTPISFNYVYNDANQRIQCSLPDGSFWVYQYDSLGQVKSGKKYWPDWTPAAGQQFEYGFDDIGNRTSTKAGGDAVGAGLRSASYSPNNLNQYTSRDIPGALDVVGVALASDTVTVNSASVYRHGEYYRKEVSAANTSVPVWQSVAVAATGETTVNGNVFVPKTQEQFTYDLDGNLTSDGRWNYTWDAENRLLKMAANTSVGPQNSLQFEYDSKSRRIRKQVWSNTTWSGTSTNDVRFLFDVWNLIATVNSSSSVLESFLWGLDLSGSPQGAGGIGGLLTVTDATLGTHFAAFDGNGNVSGLVKASDGTASALHIYGPFGELLRATGPMTKANPFRSSTKYQDDETDLLYYGYRSYNPSIGRWVNRDPVGEEGLRTTLGWGIAEVEAKATDSSLVFVNNAPCASYDAFGLWPSKNHWLLYPEPNPLTHENSNSRTLPDDLPDHDRARLILDSATRYVDTHQAVRESYMHAMKADWQSVGTAKARANDYVRRHLTSAEGLLCVACSSNSRSWELALWEFGQALHTVQDATSPAHWGFQTWWSPYTYPIGALAHLQREGFDPGPNSHLDRASTWMWGFFKCKDSAPPLPQDFFLGIQPDYRDE